MGFVSGCNKPSNYPYLHKIYENQGFEVGLSSACSEEHCFIYHMRFFGPSYSVLQMKKSRRVSVSKNQGTETALSEKDRSKNNHFLHQR